MNGIVNIPTPANEAVKDYAPGSPERASLKARLDNMLGEVIEIPAIIGGREVFTGDTIDVVCPHDHGHVLARCHQVSSTEVEQAVNAAARAWNDWSEMPWESRAAIFLKAADLLAGPWRDTINAATMLGQSKTVYQAEIDAAAEMCDFWRFNAGFMQQIYRDQPESAPGIWNYVEYRALEGFIFAVSPFNFTSIGGNLSVSAGPHGQHGALEAGLDRLAVQLLAGAPARGSWPARRRDPVRAGDRGSKSWATRCSRVRRWRACTSPDPRPCSGRSGGPRRRISIGTARIRGSSARPAARTSSWRIRAPMLPRSPRRCSGGPTSTRARSARRRRVPTSPVHLGPGEGTSIGWARRSWRWVGDPPTSGVFVGAVIDEASVDQPRCSYLTEARGDAGVEIIAGGNADDCEG